MSLTILTGLPGSGKSETLITEVNAARRQGRTVLTFLCGDSPVLRARPGIAKRRKLGCRSGLSTPLDHFVSADRCVQLVDEAPANALLAFDEAQHFGEQLVESWCAAAERGTEVLIASPSAAQLESLTNLGHEATPLRLMCQVCREQEASSFFCHLDEDRTESVCIACFDRLKREAETEIVDRLRRGGPHPGKEWVYQPVELPECENWGVTREDTQRRFELIKELCADEGLPGAHSTYLDVGCNTGFFCYRMAKAGFKSTGVDITANDIKIARLLSTYCRRDYATYAVADAHEYLKATQDETYDVTSAFSVFQWVMIQKTAEQGLDCMRWLFRKTGRICILEMGESTEAHYIKRVGLKYDSAWIHDFMQTHGGFEQIVCIDMKLDDLKRDLFIGYKSRHDPASNR